MVMMTDVRDSMFSIIVASSNDFGVKCKYLLAKLAKGGWFCVTMIFQ